MKIKFTLISLALFGFLFTKAQITLSNTDMPAAGWSEIMVKDTPVTSINYGSNGANRVYDFSALTVTKHDTIQYLMPTSSQLSQFPNANIALTGDHGSTFIFGNISGAKYDAEGLQGQLSGHTTYANFSPVEDIYHFPTQYGGSFRGTWGFQTTVPGSWVGQSVSSVRVTYTDIYQDTIDGWGKTMTPIGNYKSLREVRHDQTETLIEVDIFGFGSYSTYSDKFDTTVSYNYLAKETKGPVVSFDYDSAGDLLSAKYSLIPPAPCVAHFTFVAGSSGLVNFTDATDGYPTGYSWNFGDGSALSTVQNPNHTFAADGVYNVCETVTYPGGSNTWCDSVTVSNALSTGIIAVQLRGIHIYPNPASDHLTIDMGGNNDEAITGYTSIEIYNALGERVKMMQRTDLSKIAELPVRDLPAGIYLAAIVDANGLRNTLGKFIK